ATNRVRPGGLVPQEVRRGLAPADPERVHDDAGPRRFGGHAEEPHRAVALQLHPDGVLTGRRLEGIVGRARRGRARRDPRERLAVEVYDEVPSVRVLEVVELEMRVRRLLAGRKLRVRAGASPQDG